MPDRQIKIGMRDVWMHKSIKQPDFRAGSVLSNDPWPFVALWLKQNKKSVALSYWLQAQRFSHAASTMAIEATPTALYYSFLNATKALLEVHSTNHGSKHGVSGTRPEDAKAYLSNEKVRFKQAGILPALCNYLGDSSPPTEYNLKDLFWNLPFVHQAYRHTFQASELFIPLEAACYVKKEGTSEAWFQARVVAGYADRRKLKNIPSSFEATNRDGVWYIRRKKRFTWIKGKSSHEQVESAIRRLTNYHRTTRRVILPICGDRELWYFKKSSSSNPVSERHVLAIIFAATHRLSELSRYDPKGLERHLAGSANWLLTEFIEHSSKQFIDQIASEITGCQFWPPGMRTETR